MRLTRTPDRHPLASLSVLAMLIVVAALPSSSAPPAGRAPAGALRSYALAAPDLTVVLPARLNEVSGVTTISDHELGCVQDEEGAVFIYDLAQQRITRGIPFGPPGDYEDIARAGSRLFVLRSDGFLFEIKGLAGRPAVQFHPLRLPASDYEGLCHDARHNRLLIAPKTRLGRGQEAKDTRAIFAFDLATASLQRDPLLVLSVDVIRAFAVGRNRAALRFMPSAIAVHPLTSEIFVMSAVDGILATFDRAGSVTGYASLDPKRFRQPEGLTFLANGDLVITNEAAGQKPTLLVFKRRSDGGAAAPQRTE